MGAAAALALAGCVASGAIQARITKPDNGGPVVMAYRSERFQNNGTLTATMPGGETFSGRYL